MKERKPSFGEAAPAGRVSRKAWTTIGASEDGDVRLVLQIRGKAPLSPEARARLERGLTDAMAMYVDQELQVLGILQYEPVLRVR